MSIQMENLIHFVKAKHGSQKRKYTGESYVEGHCIPVAEMAVQYVKFGYEIGLCHDILEDTDCTAKELHDYLVSIGHTNRALYCIMEGVIALTDVYTSEAYPHINRKVRKHREAIRLGKISPDCQSIKYCDLIHNTSSIVEHDPKFAKVYLKEKREVLYVMTKGDPELLAKCLVGGLLV